MTTRQRACYRDTVSLFLTQQTSGASSIGAAKESLYAAGATGVVCKYFPNTQTSLITPIGRMPSASKAELELFHFEADVVLKDMDMLQLTTTDHPDNGAYFVVVGDPECRPSAGNRKSNYLEVNARRATRAPNLS